MSTTGALAGPRDHVRNRVHWATRHGFPRWAIGKAAENVAGGGFALTRIGRRDSSRTGTEQEYQPAFGDPGGAAAPLSRVLAESAERAR